MAENQCTHACDRGLSPADLETTAEACAWLLPIAELGIEHSMCAPAVAEWLNAIGAAATEMRRSALQ